MCPSGTNSHLQQWQLSVEYVVLDYLHRVALFRGFRRLTLHRLLLVRPGRFLGARGGALVDLDFLTAVGRRGATRGRRLALGGSHDRGCAGPEDLAHVEAAVREVRGE